MNKDSILLPIYYISEIEDQIREAGCDVNAWLKRHKLDDPGARDFDQGVTLKKFEALVLDAMAISDEPALGLYVGERLGVTTHGMLGYAIISSGSVREMLDIFHQFVNTRTPLLGVEQTTLDNYMLVELVELHSLDQMRVPYTEAVMLTLYNVLRQITFGEQNVAKVCFPFAQPEYIDIYESMFDCEIEFNHLRAGVYIGLEGLDSPLKLADKKSLQQAKALCEEELTKVFRVDTLEYKVRQLLLADRESFPSLAEVADHFHMSSRTLHRHLEAENTSFKKILESTRHSLAVEYLRNTQISIQEIAYALGYTDIANFRRAFKR